MSFVPSEMFLFHTCIICCHSWKLANNHCFRKHYSSGPAELVFNGKATVVKGLELIFDSGSSYTYFNSQAYQAVVDLVRWKLERASIFIINFIVLYGLRYLISHLKLIIPWSIIQVTQDLKGKQLKRATDDPSLPICWKGAKSFKSLSDVKKYFKPLALSFTKTKILQMHLPPEAYLIITVSTFYDWTTLPLVKETNEIV